MLSKKGHHARLARHSGAQPSSWADVAPSSECSPPQQARFNQLVAEAEVGEDVGASGVGEVVLQVLEGTVARQNSLCTVAEHCEHGQPAILELLRLQNLQVRVRLVAQVEQVEELATGVAGVAAALECLLQAQEVLLTLAARVAEVLPPLELSELHEDDLNPEQAEGVHPVALRVCAQRRDQTALPPQHLLWALGNDAGVSQDLRGDDARRTEHGPPRVDHLAVGQPLGADKPTCALGVAEAKRVKPVVSWEVACKVGQGLV
mmetsp:Transcript_11183/g.33542  ORF Transcript_11183/g.33542 Transcript_11183/m.33542 type:complete len:262 (-) Transcript_11183:280-1065(-)